MKSDPLIKILLIAITTIFGLVSFIFQGALVDQKETDTRLEKRIDTNAERIEELGNVYEALGRIDERLKNIERAIK